jgi:hypothetical protein
MKDCKISGHDQQGDLKNMTIVSLKLGVRAVIWCLVGISHLEDEAEGGPWKCGMKRVKIHGHITECLEIYPTSQPSWRMHVAHSLDESLSSLPTVSIHIVLASFLRV